MGKSIQFIEDFFKLKTYHTTIRTEIIAGITTFLTMVYVIFVNPQILHQAGMPYHAVFLATCLTTVVGCLCAGLIANFPSSIAPSMGLNAYFTYVIVLKMGLPWQTALGAVFISGVIFFVLTVFRIRRWIINAIPTSLGIATTAGIGLFIGLIALKNAGIITGDSHTLVQLGNVHTASFVLCFLGFFLIVAFDHYKVTGAIVISILIVSLIALLLGKTHYHGILSLPPSVAPTAFKFSFTDLFNKDGIIVIFTFLLVALFDSSGTLIGLVHEAKLPMNDPDTKQRVAQALMADSLGTLAGSVLGTSTTANYIESTAGIRAGGRTGLTAVVIAILFGFAIFLSPLASMIPVFATAPALLFIASMMLKHMKHIDWDDLSEAIPAAITIIMIPFSFSIANGIGLGFISYLVIKVMTGKISQIKPGVALISAIFFLYFTLN